jgi:phenylacetate-CoA ligase
MLREYLHYLAMSRRRKWSPGHVRRRQERLLAELVRHAWNQVPFYRQWYEQAGVLPAQIRGLDDLGRLPLVRKSDMRHLEVKAPAQARDVRLEKCRLVQTSGSSGIPITIYYSRREESIRAAAFHRGLADIMGRSYFRKLNVGPLRPEIEPRLGPFNPKNRLRRSAAVEAAEKEARAFKPHLISGLVSQLYIFALSLRRRGGLDVCPEMIATGGEMLLPPTQRLLEEVFRAPVRPYYGAWEFGMIAASCRQSDAYHLCTDDLLVECVAGGRTARPGEEGELVITSLTARTMPFIRYAIGDIAVMGTAGCSCGHPYPRLESLRGRSDDLLVRADGRVLTPFLAAEPLYRLMTLKQFRVTQETVRKFIVEYVADGPLERGEVDRIRRFYAEELLAAETVIRRVPEIPVDPSGKIRKFISRVPRKEG